MPGFVERSIRSIVTKGVIALARRNGNSQRATAPNPYLTGVHQPMREERTLENLRVRGTIPSELDGKYIRIGPNQITPTNPAVHHWFMGDGMVHGLRLQNGRALWYRNRWIRSTAVSTALGETPAPGPRRASDTVNTNVMGIAGRIFAMVEASGNPVELNDELETKSHNPFDGTLHGSFTAHPHRDPKSGELHSICYDFQDPNRVRHVVIGRDGRVRREEPIAVRSCPSIHDCMITERYLIVLDLPVTFSMRTLMSGYGFPFRWDEQHRARVGLLPREAKGSEILWCEVDPAYVFHAANAFDQADGSVALDVVAYPRMFDNANSGPHGHAPKFERWTVDPQSQRTSRKVIDAAAQEFPRIDERRTGQPYRYSYSVGLPADPSQSFASANHLLRHDLIEGVTTRHEFREVQMPGEFVFVPRGESESDGWLIGYVIDTSSETTELVILDAANFSGPEVAAVQIPHRIPPGFHGNWVPSRG